LEAIDGLVTALLGGEYLRKKDDQGDPRRVNPVAPLMTDETASGLDHGHREKAEKWQPRFLVEVIADRIELEARGRSGRVDHSALLGVVKVSIEKHQITTQGGRLHPELGDSRPSGTSDDDLVALAHIDSCAETS
jgi:hypothetical protein